MRKWIALLLLLSFTSICPVFTFAETAGPEQYTCDDFLYTVLEDGTAEIVGWLGTGGEERLIIPYELDGHPVTGNGDGAFYGRDDLTDIYFGEGITRIGNEAFRDCVNLRSVMYAYDLISIGDRAFFGCVSLRGFGFSDTVTTIGAEAFSGCPGLAVGGSIMLPDSVTGIGADAFAGCCMVVVTNRDSYAAKYCEENGIMHTDRPGMSSKDRGQRTGQPARVSERIDNGEAVYYILEDGTAEYCFYSAAGELPETLAIPEEVDGYRVSIISDNAFGGCRNLVSVTIPDSVVIIGDTAFASCPSLTEVVIGNSTTVISSSAFANCENLTAVTIPDSVNCIWPDAFYVRIKTAEKGGRGPNPALTLTVSRNSIVEKYCIENGINYTYSDSGD